MTPAHTSLDSALSGVSLHGEIILNEDDRAEVAEDFGHIVRRRPRAVLRPGSTQDVATVIRIAGEHRVPVAARGMGHSTFGQSQVHDGIVIDMRHLAGIGPVGSDTVTVEAGASWRAVVTETARHGLTPPVLTDYLGLSVGGTLSVGGVGGCSHRYGLQTDQVTQLEVVTGDGAIHTCSATSEPDLFHTARAGLGQLGLITRATLRLVAPPGRVRRYKLYYPTAAALTADQRVLLHERRFDYLEGAISPGPQGWVYMLEAASYYDLPSSPHDEHLLAGLADTRPLAESEELTYLEFADRLAEAEGFLRSTGEWLQPHPWWNAFLPDAVTDTFLEQLVTELTVDDIGPSGLILTYPLFTAPVATPLVRLPDAPVVFLVALLRTTPTDETAVRAAIADNRHRYELACSLGGTGYHVGTIPLSTADWTSHFGPAWAAFTTACQRYDPHGILCPGQGIRAAVTPEV
jgi:cytokinin dehydrogenase